MTAPPEQTARENLRGKIMKNKRRYILNLLALILSCAFAASAQVAAGGGYTLDQSVIASGGAQMTTGGAFSLDGTIGQPAAGIVSNGGSFGIRSGFWNEPSFAPTAASVTVGGKVKTPDGRGLRNAFVTLTNMRGEICRVSTSAFGYWRISDVPAGETYIINVLSKRYQFAPQIIFITEDISEVNFIAIGQGTSSR